MEVPCSLRERLLAAVIPFVSAAYQVSGIRRIALIGSLTTENHHPKDVDLLVTVEDNTDLTPLAFYGRQLLGRTLQCGNYGCDVFLETPRHRYLGRLCQWKICQFGQRQSCDALRCGVRPYLHDDLKTITLSRSLLVAPPLDLWPTLVARVVVPIDVEQTLLLPLIQRLGLQRSEQIIPQDVRACLVGNHGVNQDAWYALQEASAFLDIPLAHDLSCHMIEIRPLERYAQILELSHISRMWAIELQGRMCFVTQANISGRVVYTAL